MWHLCLVFIIVPNKHVKKLIKRLFKQRSLALISLDTDWALFAYQNSGNVNDKQPVLND